MNQKCRINSNLIKKTTKKMKEYSKAFIVDTPPSLCKRNIIFIIIVRAKTFQSN
jgi:hypothetical protein